MPFEAHSCIARLPLAYSLPLQGSVLGSVFALFAVRFSGSSGLAAGLLTSAYVALMQLPELPEGPNWARISGMTSATIIFASLGDSAQAHALLELRVLYTILGVFVYLAVTRLVFPVDARRQAHSTLRRAIGEIAQAQRRTIDLLCAFIEQEATSLTNTLTGQAAASSRGAGLQERPLLMAVDDAAAAAALPPTRLELEAGDPSSSLDSATSALSKLPELIKEAEAEPTQWKLPFRQLQPRYERISVDLQRVARNVRGLFQALLCLKTQALLVQQRRGATAQLRDPNVDRSNPSGVWIGPQTGSSLSISSSAPLREAAQAMTCDRSFRRVFQSRAWARHGRWSWHRRCSCPQALACQSRSSSSWRCGNGRVAMRPVRVGPLSRSRLSRLLRLLSTLMH